MTNQEIIEWQRQYREWSLTRIGSVCERALRAAYNDGQDGNSDVCSINRAKASAHAAKVAADELRALLRKQQSDLDATQTRTHELDDALQAACAERDAAQARMKELDREITAMRADKILFLPRPGHINGAISFDLSVVDMEGAIRNKLIEMGWTPPALTGEPR